MAEVANEKRKKEHRFTYTNPLFVNTKPNFWFLHEQNCSSKYGCLGSAPTTCPLCGFL